jgi:hypothetical protein
MKLRSIGELFNGALSLYGAHWQTLIPVALVPSVVMALLAPLTPAVEGPNAFMGSSAPLLISISLIAIILTILSIAAMVYAVADPARYRNFMDAYKASAPIFLPLIWVMILTALAVFVGFILLIIPGIIAMVWLSFAQYTVVLEGKRGIEALKASKAYVTGRWFSVFGRLIVMWIVVGVISVAVSAVISSLVPDKALSEGVSTLVGAFFTPFTVAYMYLLYRDLSAAPVAEAPVVVPPASPLPPAPAQ